MAQLPSGFAPQDHDTTQTNFELLPTGIYRLEIISSDTKSDDDNNLAVNLNYAVIAPEEFAGRRFYGWIDYQHRDAKKQEDGQRELSRLCRACQYTKPHLDDTEELHFVAFTAKVQNSPAGVSKSTGNPYKAKNRIQRFYYPDEGNVPEPAIDEVQPAPAAKPANDNRPANPSTARSTNNGGSAASSAAKPAGSRPWGKAA